MQLTRMEKPVRTICFLLAFVLVAFQVTSQVSAEETMAPSLKLMPLPASIQASPGGALEIDPSFTVIAKNSSDPRLRGVAELFLADLRWHTGMLAVNFHIASGSEPGQLEIQSVFPVFASTPPTCFMVSWMYWRTPPWSTAMVTSTCC